LLAVRASAGRPASGAVPRSGRPVPAIRAPRRGVPSSAPDHRPAPRSGAFLMGGGRDSNHRIAGRLTRPSGPRPSGGNGPGGPFRPIRLRRMVGQRRTPCVRSGSAQRKARASHSCAPEGSPAPRPGRKADAYVITRTCLTGAPPFATAS
jgi:hypothetical protein